MKTASTQPNTAGSKQNPVPAARALWRQLAAVMGLLALCFGATQPAQAAIVGPYSADANTSYLYHLNEASGASAAANAGSAGYSAVSYNGATFAGAGVNQPTVTTVLGATGFTGFGNAADLSATVNLGLGVDVSGDGSYMIDNRSATPTSADRQANHGTIFGAGNAFTLEALVKVSTITTFNQEIISTDNGDSDNVDRGFQFRIGSAGILEFNFIGVNTGTTSKTIPTTGPHAFVANEWFHVAYSYDGTTGTFYWTRLDAAFTAANSLGTAAEGVDLNDDAVLVIGNEGRSSNGTTDGSGEGLKGLIDEVRISKVARAANQMMFANTLTITAQPQNAVVQAGQTAVFTVAATTDFAPLAYQWRSNGVAIANGGDFSGATTATLTVANAVAAYQLSYDCVISNSRTPTADTTTSAAATLTIRVPLNLSWSAATDYNWNKTTFNWLDTVASTNSPFTDGDLITFDNSGLDASSINLTTTNAPGSVTVNASTRNYTLSGVGKITGATGLTKTNSGSLTLASTNDYVGVTTLAGGTVSVGFVANGGLPSPVGAAPSAPANQVWNGGTLSYTGGTASTDRGVTLGANGGTLDIPTTATTLTMSGVIVGTSGGRLTKTGTGTLALSGANTYDGATTISAGTVQLTGSGTFGAGNVTNNGTILSSGNVSITNSIAGTGSITNDAMGTLTLSGNNTYSGVTSVNGPSFGGLVVASSGALGNSPQVVVFSTTGGAFGGTRVTLNPGVVTPATTTLTLPSVSTTVRSALATTGESTWGGNIVLSGDGNTANQLAFLGSTNLIIAGNVSVNNYAGTLQLRGGAGLISGNLNLATNGTVQVNDGVTWTIASTGNTWGLSQIASGIMRLGTNNALPTNTTVNFGAAGNGTLDLGGFNQQVAALTISGGVNTIGNSSTNSDSTLLFVATNVSTYTGSIVDALGAGTRTTALTVGGGTLVLSASNSYSGLTLVSNASLLPGNGWALGSATGGTVVANNSDVSVFSSLTLMEPFTLNGTSGAGGSFHHGGGSTITLGGVITAGSDTTIKSDGGCTLNLTNTVDTAGHTITYVNDGGANGNFSGPIIGAGGFAKNNAGTATLTASNTYSGDTTVFGGTLALSGAGAIASSPTINVFGGAALNVSGVSGGFALGAGQTLIGNGTVTGAATLNGTLAPGASIGSLTFGTAPVLGGTIVAELDRSSATNADKVISSSGTLTFGGTLTVTNIGPALVNGDMFDLLDGTLAGLFTTLNLPVGAGHWNISDLNVGGTIVFTNANPVASDFALGVPVGGSVSATVIGKFAAATDADGDAVTITVISTPANGTASIVGGTNLLYTSTNNAAGDSFTYTVSDGLGGADTKTVTVSTYSPEGFNRLSPPSVIGMGTVTLSYLGIPGYNYALDWATNLTPPINWIALVTNTASGDGSLSYTNTSSEPANFFRTRYVP